MAIDRIVKRVQEMKPSKTQPLHDSPRNAALPAHQNQPFPQEGNPVWHGVTGERFARPLPESSKGPIRAREIRRKKGLEGY